MRQLINRCSAFRLLDLPLELREAIYDMALGESKENICCMQGRHGMSIYDVDRVLAITDSKDVSDRTGNPPLLHVSRQVRSEAGKMFFGRRSFQVCIDTVYSGEAAQEDVNMWLKTIVGSFATHLTDVRMHFHGQHGKRDSFETTIRAQFCQRRGLQVTGSSQLFYEDASDGEPRLFLCMPAHVAALEENRITRGQKGEVIVDLFRDWDALVLGCLYFY